jgi:SAM-dependent methyltransferase/FKBP-type peptidyl-prolyl cis-trans isomerase 2
MDRVDTDSKVDLLFQLKWSSGRIRHTDCYQASRVNIWRDILPAELLERMMGLQTGDSVSVTFAGGKPVPAFNAAGLLKIKRSQFTPEAVMSHSTDPRVGRFYPKGLLRNVSGVFSDNLTPFRCVGVQNGDLSVDFNHPLAGKTLHLTTIVGRIEPKHTERGGTSVDWMERITQGPGMQARWGDTASDFFTDSAFDRQDATADPLFYSKPRLTRHLDDTALSMVTNTYDRFLDDGMRVLDLMSSWQSHLPGRHRLERVVGLGLNKIELDRNPQLTESVVQDLNRDPNLPFGDHAFDVVLCTASVEYLVDPWTVFAEVLRVLKPGGYLVITFSNRWFPPKVTRLWTELHEFERMGLVLEYFLNQEGFEDLRTYSMRGLPRPHDDKYFPELFHSDPLYAVWGRKRTA